MPRGKYIHKKRPDLILRNKSEKQRLAVSFALKGKPSLFKGKKKKTTFRRNQKENK